MWMFSAKCRSNALLTGKTAVITGGNTGIGKETAKDFYKRGARVIIACRSLERANQAAEDIRKQCQNETNLGTIVVEQLNLNNLSLVRKCAENLLKNEKRIDLLVNNAGIMITPVRSTDDGFESHFGVNHLGHFLFTLLLLPKIIQSAPSRIVTVSSVIHERGVMDFDDLSFERKQFHQISAYAQSKLANVLFTKELARRLQEQGIEGVTTYSLHPGVIATELGRNADALFPGMRLLWRIFGRWSTKTPFQGAQTTIHCSVDEQAGNETGLYYSTNTIKNNSTVNKFCAQGTLYLEKKHFNNFINISETVKFRSECKVTKPSNRALNEEDAKKLWDISVKLTGLEDYNPFNKL